MVSCCCWRTEQGGGGGRQGGRSRSLDREPRGQYLDLVLEEQGQEQIYDLTLDAAMGNTQGKEGEGAGAKDGLMKAGSSSSLKSNGSHKSSSSRRSKVTFTELHPEIYMIPPKSPPKPKRSRGANNRSPVSPEEEQELLLAMRSDEVDSQVDSQAAFQFDLSQQARVVCLEDIERNSEKPYAVVHRNGHQNREQEKIYDLSQQEKIYDQVPGREDTPEDVQQVQGDRGRIQDTGYRT